MSVPVCISSSSFSLMIRRPPRSTRTDTLFPYTTLFRSKLHLGAGLPARADPAEARSPLRSVGNGEKWTRQTSVAPEYRFRRVKSRIDCAGGSSPGSAARLAHAWPGAKRLRCGAPRGAARAYGKGTVACPIGRASCRERVVEYG